MMHSGNDVKRSERNQNIHSVSDLDQKKIWLAPEIELDFPHHLYPR